MLIKYFYCLNSHSEFDKNSMMVIPEVKKSSFNKIDIVNLLEIDKVQIMKIESIKYYSKEYSGWLEISDKSVIDMRGNRDKELLLLIKMQELPVQSSEIHMNLMKLVRTIELQEERLRELESGLKRYKSGSFYLAKNNSSAILSHNSPYQKINKYGNEIELLRNNSLGTTAMFMNDDSRLDISFLYSNPLVKDHKDGIQKLNDPIDFESEINCLIDILNDAGKKISARFEVANLDSISEIIRKKPKILHISCHGEYEEIDGESKFYLSFEDNKGKLDKFDTEKLNNLLRSSNDDKSQIEIVFVSACHSEAVADVFKNANVPAVICVHSATKVLDQAAQKFAKIFYNSLLDGSSVSYAFEQAKRVVSAGIDQNAKNCCCSHKHHSECRWHEKSIKNHEFEHQIHLKMCKCNFKESHMHLLNCIWAKNLIVKYEFKFIEVGCSSIKICCCSPEAAHDESFKFIIKSDPEYLNETPFSKIPSGNLELKNKTCGLSINFSVEMKSSLIGRNLELYSVISMFSNNLLKNRLVTVHGKEGVGKNSFAKLAGKYMYERRFFQDGVIYINSRGYYWSEMWFVSKVITHLQFDMPIHEISRFCDLISQLRILIIINFSKQKEEAQRELKETINKILEGTRNTKFLITCEKPLELETQENKIELKSLDNFSSAKLLLTLAGQSAFGIIPTDVNDLKNHNVIKIAEGIPWKIHQIAGLLRENKKLDTLLERLNSDKMKKQILSEELVKLLLDNITQNSNLIHEILYILSILPQGILDSEVYSIFKNNSIEVMDILDYISSNTILITKSKNKDVGQIIYLLSEDINSTIEALKIEEIIKLKCYKNLIIYYSKLMRDIVINLSQFSHNESATEFSASQNYGMWLNLRLNQPSIIFNKIYEPCKRYDFNEANIISLLRFDNNFLSLAINNDQEFLESIEDLSICMPTILKINKKVTECNSTYTLFKNICEKYNLNLAQGRLFLFISGLQSYLTNSISKSNFSRGNYDYPHYSFQNILAAKNIFSDKYLEGEAESYFAKAVFRHEEEIIHKGRNINDRISKDSFDDIIKDLNSAIKLFRRIQNNFGLARTCFIFAEYNTRNKYYEEAVLEHYKEALKIFEKENKKILQVKCLQGMGKWYMGIKNYVMSKDYIEQAKFNAQKMKTGKNNNELILYEIDKQMNELLDQSRIESHNVFVFIKAHQLTNIANISKYNVTNHYSTFRDRLYKKFDKQRKELIVKFDFLTEKNLIDVFKKQGRVLHISSDDYDGKGSLFVEGPNGESEEITSARLKLMVGRNIYDLVIIAIPQGENLAKIFVEAGIPHVICFTFDDEFLRNGISLPHVNFFDVIHEFTISMLSSIILEQTVEDAFNSALREFKTKIINIIDRIDEFYFISVSGDERNPKEVIDLRTHDGKTLSTNFSNASATIHLLPKTNNHQCKLYGKSHINNNEETVLYEGKILDLSKVRARLHNIEKRKHAIIGRKKELFDCINIIKNFIFLNLFADSGSGKTVLAKETCYFLYMRNYFRDGIFYFDIMDVKNIEKIKALLHGAHVYDVIDELKNFNQGKDVENESQNPKDASNDDSNRRILIIFDNAEKIIKYKDNQFFIYLKSLSKEQNLVHFILTTNKKIENELVERHLEIPRLSSLESANLFLHYLNRNINKKEIDIDTSEYEEDNLKENHYSMVRNMCDLVESSTRLKACRGMPKYIKNLAVMCQNMSLKSVDLKLLNLPKKKNRNGSEYSSNKNDLKESKLTHTGLNLTVNNSNGNNTLLENENPEERTSIPKSLAGSYFKNSYITNPNNRQVIELENLTQVSHQLNKIKDINLRQSINLQTDQGSNSNSDYFNSNNLNKSQLDQSLSLFKNLQVPEKKSQKKLKNPFAKVEISKENPENPFTASVIAESLNSSINIEDTNSSKATEMRESNNTNNTINTYNTYNTFNTYNTYSMPNKQKMNKVQSDILEVEEEEIEQKFLIIDEETSNMSYKLDGRHIKKFRSRMNFNNNNIIKEINDYKEFKDYDLFDESIDEDGNEDDSNDTFINNQAFNSEFKITAINNFKNNPTETCIPISSPSNLMRDSLRFSIPQIEFYEIEENKMSANNIINLSIIKNSSQINVSNYKEKEELNPFKNWSNVKDILKVDNKQRIGNKTNQNQSVKSNSKLENTLNSLNSNTIIGLNNNELATGDSGNSNNSKNKKKKKGMKSGKMHDKYKQKKNNKYNPNQNKKTQSKYEE